MSKVIKTGFISDKINGIKVNKSLKCNSDNFNNKSSREVLYIVIHYTGNEEDTAKGNANYFTSPNRMASAHFFVDDENIYQSVELKDVAWHCGSETGVYYHSNCRNNNSIGIEMCCTAGDYKASKKTIENTAYLCADMCKRVGIKSKDVNKCVLRHYDITHKKCPAQFVGVGSKYNEWKKFKKTVKKILDGKQKGYIDEPYIVKITSETNIRCNAGVKHKIVGKVAKNEVYTIIEKKNGWGKLKSGAGWVYLKRTKKI